MNIDFSRVVSALYSVYCENFTIAGQARQLEQDAEELREDQEALKDLVPLLEKEAQVLRDNPELLAESPQVVLKDDGTVDVKDLQDRDSEIQLLKAGVRVFKRHVQSLSFLERMSPPVDEISQLRPGQLRKTLNRHRIDTINTTVVVTKAIGGAHAKRRDTKTKEPS